MKAVVQSKGLTYIKLALVSPQLEIITNLIYIISFLLLAANYTYMGINYSNYEITKMTEQYFELQTFNSINNDTQFISYLELILNKLFTFNPNQTLPIFIPLDPLRLTKFALHPHHCSDKLSLTNNNNVHTYTCYNNASCTAETFIAVYNHTNCGQPYSSSYYQHNTSSKQQSSFSGFVSTFYGEYGQYNLETEGEHVDFTVDEFNANKPRYEEFIQSNKGLKFIVIQSNLYIPSNDNYVYIIAGIEMINYFTHTFPIFKSTVYRAVNPNNDPEFMIIYVLYSCSVILIIIKLLYEINIKPVLSIHFFMFINEVLNLVILIFTAFYLKTCNDDDIYKFNVFHSKLPLICIRKYLIVFISLNMICIPFRIISLISWCKHLSAHVVKYLGIVFRMCTGIAVIMCIILIFLFMFALMNYTLYNEVSSRYKDIYSSFISIFDFAVIDRLINDDYKLQHSPSHSSYYIIINWIQLSSCLALCGIFIASMCLLFKRASAVDEVNEDNKILTKLTEIEEVIKETPCTIDNNIRCIHKRILWLNLTGDTNLYYVFRSKSNIVLMSNVSHVLSFMKVLFVLKPEMQYQNLKDKYGILIEIKVEDKQICSSDLCEIDILLDWLTFVGVKIPVMVYSPNAFERNVKMKMLSYYPYLYISNDNNDINQFVKVVEREISICKEINISFIY